MRPAPGAARLWRASATPASEHKRGSTWSQPAFTGQCVQTIHTLPVYGQVGLESFGDSTLAVGPRLSGGHFAFANGSTVYYGKLAFPHNGISAVPVVASRAPTTTVPAGCLRSSPAAA